MQTVDAATIARAAALPSADFAQTIRTGDQWPRHRYRHRARKRQRPRRQRPGRSS